ncbi:MAG: glutamate-1-semialdehyde 2,1-aminomutase [Pseudomonadota bacterium]|nr:glutamate-1-semialdehyde 2,1-aminomutase [Pseudomonadota bacterium]
MALTRNKSEQWFKRAETVLPGGVSSPVRAFGAVGGTPPVIRWAKGTQVIDENGHKYLDFVGSWGPLILGHAHPAVVESIQQASARGTSYGAPTGIEIKLAEEVVDSYPRIEQVRFVSSGTEAVMSAVRLARGVTGRDIIVKFSGCYHGHSDGLLVAAGSGLTTFGKPSSDGVPEDFARLTIVLPLDDTEALLKLFKEKGDCIAAVIIEPVPANNGLLLQRPQFLETLRAQCTKYEVLLIFDEVISGFRLGRGGAAEHYGVIPDLATFGKVIGGGMPVGAFAGPKATMKHLAPAGGVYQAGTLSGNPVAMAAGLTTLNLLKSENGWHTLEQLGSYLENTLGPVLAESPMPAKLCRLGSLFWIAWLTNDLPRSAEAINPNVGKTNSPIFHELLAQGVALAPSAYEVGFLSLAHTQQDIDRLGETLATALKKVC